VAKLPTRLTMALTAGTAAVLFTAACGGSGSDDSNAGGGNGADGMSAYLNCLREQGIDIQVPSGGPGRGFPSGGPSGFPSGGPSGLPSGAPTVRPSGGPGGPGGGFRPDGVDEETWQKAQQACRSAMPSGGPGGMGPGGGNRGADAAYRNCLSDRGVDISQANNTADATVTEAVKACEALRPTASPSS
jgi:hypothetical protein